MPAYNTYDGTGNGRMWVLDGDTVVGELSKTTSNTLQNGAVTVQDVQVQQTGPVHRAVGWDEVNERLEDHFERFDEVLRNLA